MKKAAHLALAERTARFKALVDAADLAAARQAERESASGLHLAEAQAWQALAAWRRHREGVFHGAGEQDHGLYHQHLAGLASEQRHRHARAGERLQAQEQVLRASMAERDGLEAALERRRQDATLAESQRAQKEDDDRWNLQRSTGADA